MPTIKVIVLSDLKDRMGKTSATEIAKKLALNHLTDEIVLIPDNVTKETLQKIIKTKRNLTEQECCEFIEMEQEEMCELSLSRDTILRDLNEIISQLE